MHARIWYEPDGSVKVTTFVDGADPGTACDALLRDGHVHKNATFDDVATQAELDTLLPADRSQRDKWRKGAGRGVVVDVLVPDKPHPKQAALDAIDNAKSLDELKAAVRESLR